MSVVDWNVHHSQTMTKTFIICIYIYIHMLFLNRGFMEQIIMWIGNYDLGPDPQDFPRLARPSPRRDFDGVFFLFEIFKNPPRTH